MTTLENWNTRHLERYRVEVSQGQHDRTCEQRERSSLCHCSKRRREAEGKTELPEIFFQAPYCSGCHQEVEFDGDGFTCHRCSVSWRSNASDGDKADHFTDDYGAIGTGEQFGRRLLEIVREESHG